MGVFASAADLILGASCPGCGQPALTLCRACGLAMRPDPYVAWPTPTPPLLQKPRPVVPVAGGANVGVLRAALIVWKEHGRFGLTVPLSHLLAAAAGHHVAPMWWTSWPGPRRDSCDG
jgi:predicted amidophosphoribosyltransferase